MITEPKPSSTEEAATGSQTVSQAEIAAAKRAARAQELRNEANLLLREQKFGEAKRALEEAEKIAAEGSRLADASAERERATALMNEGKYAEAKEALERADRLEAGPGASSGPKKFFAALRSRIREKTDMRLSSAADPVSESGRIVSLYSKIAAGVGLIPGGLINFGAILAVQIVMVSRIAKAFGETAGKDRIRGVILSLFGSAIPTVVGHGAALSLAAIPAMIAGTIVYVIATPVLAYALTRAVGNTFTIHFESGGTLLTFDPKKFGDHFLNEFQKAGGTIRKPAVAAHAEPLRQTV